MAIKESKIIGLSIFIVSFLALFLGFLFNVWKVVDQDKFDKWDRQSESLTVGRIVKARTDGIFSGAGLPGRCSCDCNTIPQKVDYQYEAFNKKSKCENFYPYLSQIGFHAIFYSMLDSVLPFSPPTNLLLLRAIKSATLALVMSLIILWFCFEFGLISSIFVFLGVLLAPWFTLMGKDLWFCVWTNFLPFLVLLYILRWESSHGKPSELRIILIGSLAVLVNFIFNGYEWVSTTLIMAAIPFFYYWRNDRWPFSKLARRVAYLAAGCTVALLVTFSVLVYQIFLIKGKFSSGIDWIIFSFQKRAYGGAEMPEVYAKQIDHSIWSIFRRYFGGAAVEFPDFMTNSLPPYLVQVYFAEYVFVVLVLTVLFYYPANLIKLPEKKMKHFRDLALVTWISILAPFSWYVIFKGHAWSHYPLDYITWFMPFCLFGLAMTGALLSHLAKKSGIISRKHSP